MLIKDPQFITNKAGKKISVLLPMKEYKSILKSLEEIEDIRLFDAGVSSDEPSYPIDKAFAMIESKRKKKNRCTKSGLNIEQQKHLKKFKNPTIQI